MKDIESILQKYAFLENDLKEPVNNFYKYSGVINNPNFNKDKASDNFYLIQDHFGKMLQAAATEIKMKEYCSFSESIYPKSYSPSVWLNGENCFYISTSLWRGDFSLNYYISFADHLKGVGDIFWQMLTKLFTLGEVEYYESPFYHKNKSDLRKSYPNLFSNKKKHCQVSRLMRDYFLNQMELEHVNELGTISVKWYYTIPYEEMMNKYFKAFSLMYKLNRMLLKEETETKKMR